MRKLLLLIVVMTLVGCTEGPADGEGVSMESHSFTPETLSISVGETVHWVNDTSEAHTVTAVENSVPEGAAYFSSGGAQNEEEANDSLSDALINPGDEFEWTFDDPGTYRYYCIPHRGDGMVGTIVVER